MADEQQPAKLSRQQAHEDAARSMEEAQKRHPDEEMRLDSGWWKPGLDFSFDVKEQLDESTHQRFSALFQRIFTERLTPDESAQVVQEARSCLSGHPGLTSRFDAIFASVGPGLWDAVDKIKEQN